MQLQQLKAQIKEKNLDKWYVFTGPEVGVMDIYIDQMSKSVNARVIRVDSPEDVVKLINTPELSKQYRICVLSNCKSVLSNEQFITILDSIPEVTDISVVLVYESVDKRSKLYKNNQDKIVEFEVLRSNVLAKYISNKVNLSDEHIDWLIEACEKDYSRIMLEVDKIIAYSAAKNISNDTAIEQLIKDGAIHKPPTDAVFSFVDAVMMRKKKRAFELLAESYASGEATLVLIVNLYNTAKQTLQVQSYSGNNIEDATGLTPFQIKMAKHRLNVYQNGELIYLMRLVSEVEQKIKLGEIEDAVAVPYILVRFWE